MQIGNLEVTPAGDREVVMRRAFAAPAAQLFDALVRPELLKQWLLGPGDWSLDVCDIDVRPGGALRYVWRHPDGREMGLRGTYREIDPPRLLVHTELFDEDWTDGETVVIYLLDEEGGRTQFSMSVLYNTEKARDAALATPMAEGCALAFDRLEALLLADAC